MPKYCLLLALCCLLTPRVSKAQTAPRSPLIVRLDSGEVAAHRYVCLDTATYRTVRQQVAAVGPLRQRVGLLEYDRQLLEKQVADARREGKAANTDFTATARQLEIVRPMPPLLLSPQFYRGIGVGFVLTVALKLFLHF